MKFILYSGNKRIDEFNDIESVDRELEKLAKKLDNYHRLGTPEYIKGAENERQVKYLILTKVFDKNDNIVVDMKNRMIAKK